MRWIIALALSLLVAQSSAQVPSSHAGLGTPTPAAGYTGPIDVNGTAYAFWSTRCGATAYTGNVIDVWDGATGSTTETLVTCSSGGTLNETINSLATTCAVSCRVKTIYDQSGSNKCTTACDVTQATNSKRPTLVLSCQNGLACMQFTLASVQCLAKTIVTSAAAPITTSFVGFRTGSFTTNQQIFGTAALQLSFNSSTNSILYYDGGGAAPTATASDSAIHAIQVINTSPTGSFYVDGSSTSFGANDPGNSGVDASAFGIGARGDCTTGPITAKVFEIGIWASDKSANNATMNSNQHTYWNF